MRNNGRGTTAQVRAMMRVRIQHTHPTPCLYLYARVTSSAAQEGGDGDGLLLVLGEREHLESGPHAWKGRESAPAVACIPLSQRTA